MLIQPLGVAWANYVRATRVSTALFACNFMFLLLLGIALSGNQLHAQTYSTLDLSDVTHTVTGPSGNWSLGDTVTFEVTLATVDIPIDYVVGLQIALTLGQYTVVPNSLGISVANSWCFDATNLTTAVSTAGTPTVLTLSLIRADSSSQSGGGYLFRFNLLVGINGLKTNEMIVNDGGLVIIENVDAKMAALSNSQVAESMSKAKQFCFPNPTQGLVHIPLQMDVTMEAILVAMDGRNIQLRPMMDENGTQFDLQEFPAGLYQLQIVQNGKPIFQDRILKR